MLNKELLITKEDIPTGHILLTVGNAFELFTDVYGYSRQQNAIAGNYGRVNKVPYWRTRGYDSLVELSYVPAYENVSGNLTSPKTNVIMECTDSLTRAPQRFMVTVFINEGSHTWMFDGSETNGWASGDPFNLSGSVGKTLSVTFDPPRWILGSRDTQTDLEYCVEEAPWEAQDAEQGTSDDGRRRGVVDCKVPVLRRFVYIVIVDAKVRRRREYCLGREPKLQRYSIEDSSNSNDIHDPYMERRDMRSQCRKRSFNRCITEKNGYLHYRKQYVSRGYIQSVISKEALYA